ncbi:MAG: cytochrome d ubiquinol oxidase subunit II [Micropruina sp.]|uniref:cytochrome d ubiquinol oxidase subunit II n=1 Tax=Micropruina sp. TaxID=2737536 RepID=UPI0039E39F3D
MTLEPTTLQLVWFGLIAVLWIGFLVLEGFDFGVGMLIPYLGRNDKERRVLINTIGPVWDGNEVWLLTAGGATFAAFPGWYATLFSALYLPFFLILMALIVRGLAFEYRAKRPEQSWKYRWDRGASIGSFAVPLILGIGFSNFIIGLPVAPAEGRPGVHVFTGGFWSLFHPFALLGGVVLVALCLLHGAIFLALKTRDEVHERAKAFAERIGLGVIGGGAVWLLWSNLAYSTGASGWILMVVAAAGLVLAWFMVRADREGWAFVGTAVATAVIAIGIFLRMYPNLGFDNSAAPDKPLNILSASASEMTLTIMTWAAVIFVPLVLAYQAWSYWVFRRRLSTVNIPDDHPETTPVG